MIKYAVNINIRHHRHYILRYSLLRGTMVSRVVCLCRIALVRPRNTLFVVTAIVG